jgi:2-dehydropantoate 2-reductase
LQTQGIRLTHWDSGEDLAVQLPTIDRLDPEDAYDLVLVILPRHRVAETLPVLAASRRMPNVMFFGNNAAGPAELIATLGAERVLLGFPGAAAYPEDDRIRYLICSAREQSTTLGELDGRRTERITQIASALNQAGFPVAGSPRRDACSRPPRRRLRRP